MRLTRRFLPALVLALAAVLPSGASAQQEAKALRVYAASSLTDAMKELGDMYAATGAKKPVFVYASSSVLARQIEQGAPADFFVSADEPWMDYVSERKLIDPATRNSMLSNRLVLVAPRDSAMGVKLKAGVDLLGALKGGKLAMGDPDSVPAGKYGKAALQSLGVWSKVEGSVVRAENVRAALLFVERGEANAGIVYLTDQMASKGVKLVDTFPAISHPKISYPMAVVRGGMEAEAAKFEAFLKTPEAKAVFTRLGFITE